MNNSLNEDIPGEAFCVFLETCSQMSHDIAGKMHVVQFIADELEEMVLAGRMDTPELVHRLQSATEGTNIVLDNFRKMLKTSQSIQKRSSYEWCIYALEILELSNSRRELVFTAHFNYQEQLPALASDQGFNLVDCLYAALYYVGYIAEAASIPSIKLEFDVKTCENGQVYLNIREYSGLMNNTQIRQFFDEESSFHDQNKRLRRGWELIVSDCKLDKASWEEWDTESTVISFLIKGAGEE